jgi:membrane associated rhomboid family serine protease
MSGNQEIGGVRRELRRQATILGGLVAIFWFLEVIDWIFFHGSLDRLGIRPRTLIGLRGILLAPLLHAGFGHLLANTVPFLILGWFVMVRRQVDFYAVTGITALVSGLGIWLIGPARSVHIGASGLIFGYFGFLLFRGYFERSISSVLWSVFVGLLYGGMLFGIFPRGVGISWQAHLFGFAGGALAAYLLTRWRTTTGPRDSPSSE